MHSCPHQTPASVSAHRQAGKQPPPPNTGTLPCTGDLWEGVMIPVLCQLGEGTPTSDLIKPNLGVAMKVLFIDGLVNSDKQLT